MCDDLFGDDLGRPDQHALVLRCVVREVLVAGRVDLAAQPLELLVNVDGAAVGDPHGQTAGVFEPSWVPADVAAQALDLVDSGSDVVVLLRVEVHAVGVTRGDSRHDLSSKHETDPDRGMRGLDRFRREVGLLEVVVGAVVGDRLLGPERLYDVELLFEDSDAFGRSGEPEPPGFVLVGFVSWAHANVEPPTAGVVERRSHLGEHAGVAPSHWRHQRAQSDSRCGFAERTEDTPCVVGGRGGLPRHGSHDVVVDPH